MGATITANNVEQPRIYVACLAAYNAGYLHGAWIDAAQEPWTIWGAVQEMLRASPVAGAEEWAIHDVAGFGPVRISEHAGLDTVAELAKFIAEHGALGAALLDHYSGNLDDAREAITDRYLGAHASLEGYVQDITEEAASIPHALRYYIDWRALARDAELNGEVFTVTTAWDVVHVFAGV